MVWTRHVAVFLFYWALSGCGNTILEEKDLRGPPTSVDDKTPDQDNAEDGNPEDPNNQRDNPTDTTAPKDLGLHHIIVMDDGFDLGHEALQDKIAASYKISCPEPDQEVINATYASFEEFKAAYKTEEQDRAAACELIELPQLDYTQEINDYAEYRDSFNEAILAGKPAEFSQGQSPFVLESVKAVLSGYSFEQETVVLNTHGTLVSSIIAHENDNVRLIPLQFELAKTEEIEQDFCPTSSSLRNMEFMLQLMDDPEYLEIRKEAEKDPLLEKLEDVVQQFDIKMVNGSFGSPPYKMLEERYLDSCQQASAQAISRMMQLQKALDKRRAEIEKQLLQDPEYREKNKVLNDVLFVQAAGNEAAQIDSGEDMDDCHDDGSLHLMIGSFNQEGNRSSFSNFGDCVDYYALGSDLLAAAPNGFYTFESGTSFAAPNTIRLITQSLPASSSVADILSFLESSSDSRSYLKATDSFPTMDLESIRQHDTALAQAQQNTEVSFNSSQSDEGFEAAGDDPGFDDEDDELGPFDLEIEETEFDPFDFDDESQDSEEVLF